jgi:hypothetical protein
MCKPSAWALITHSIAIGILASGLMLAPTTADAARYPLVVRNLIKEGIAFSSHQDQNTGTVTICEHGQTGCSGTWTCTNGDCKCSSGACTPPPARVVPKGGKGREANKDVNTRASQESCTGPCKTRSPLLQQNILESGGGSGANRPSGSGTPGAGGGATAPSGPSLR